MAMRAAKRLQLDGTASHTLRLVIENHLLMASLSQRRDLDDPAVIRNFARQIQTPEALESADAADLRRFAGHERQTVERLQGFAALAIAFARAMTLLTGGTEFRRASAQTDRIARCRKCANWRRQSISDEELDAHFATLPPPYFQIHTAKEILDDLELAHRFMHRLILQNDRALSPVTAWLDEPDRGYNVVKICTWDRAGLFGKIAGSLSAAGLNILSAQIFTRTDGIALDTFFVNDARTGNLAAREQHDKFAGLLEKVLNGEPVDLPALIARQITNRPVY